jgi:hypothetical protein
LIEEVTKEELEQVKTILRSDWAKDLMGYEIMMQDLAKDKTWRPKNTCGQCSAYKTPFCAFQNYRDVIKKSDQCCIDFYPDRHIQRDKLKKPRIVQRRVE